MGEWKEEQLKNLTDYIVDNRGKTPPTCEMGHDLLEVNAISSGRRNPDYSEVRKFVSDETFKTWFRKGHPKPGDILVPTVGTIGNVALIDEHRGAIAQNLIALRLKTDVDSRYVFYFLSSPLGRDLLISLDIGGVQPSIKVPHLLDMHISLPPLPEQKAIAAILSSLDDKIDLLHRQNKTLEALAETLFRKWFIEDAESKWPSTTFSEHTEVFRGLSYKGSGLSVEGVGVPMHNLNSVYEGGGYKYEGIKYYTGDYRDRHIVMPGDIIVTNTEQGHEFRLIGFPAIVPDYFGDKGIFSQHIYKLILRKETYLTEQFFYYLIMSPQVREQITGATNGSTVNMLAIDGLQQPKFNLPPKDKVLKFSEIVRGYWKKQSANQIQIRTLEKLRDSLLPKLMSGEIRVKDIEKSGVKAS